jgi:hypothetical protein
MVNTSIAIIIVMALKKVQGSWINFGKSLFSRYITSSLRIDGILENSTTKNDEINQ